MKALTPKDLPKSDALKLVEVGYAAGRCQTPEEFQGILGGLRDIFPIDSVVCGFGEAGNGMAISEFWKTAELPPLKIIQVLTDDNYPKEFHQFYINENILQRDCHFYQCLLTQKPQLWIDLYHKDRHPFDPRTKRGFDPQYVEMALDHDLPFVLRQTTIDLREKVSNFSLTFHKKKEAHQFSELFEAFTPYLHMAILRAFGQASKGAIGGSFPFLSHREREILKWLIEGKSNWEIGRILHIAERTVKFHVQSLMRKLGATNRYHLVANAFMKNEGELA